TGPTCSSTTRGPCGERTGQGGDPCCPAQPRVHAHNINITAPFSGRVSNRRVSIGSLISGGSGSTNGTPLTSIVSVDPIHLDFDMSEADYLAFSREHAKQKGALADKVEVALGDETEFPRQGMLDFVDNVLNRSSGTL